MRPFWVYIEETLKPGKPLIRIVTLLGSLKEGAHVAAIQEAGQGCGKRCVLAFLGLNGGHETVNLCAREMSAEEGQSTGPNKWHNAAQRVAEENEEGQRGSGNHGRIHEGAKCQLGGLCHGFHLVENDDFTSHTYPVGP